ncbi:MULTISPECIES: type VII toxin-antitoxin system HepT family RNase toxin [Thermoanaerobacter]|jgi:uncharacterized protein YutE (UPF0331/DUF86 family)|uniref:Uncharacterized protein YutE (UPF0331/DUF86 family) n=1 Tax=Thermoanaerobacter pentosaceus TaxID=694059 RepID=A0ABT9M614_9THEO|nr:MULTISPECIES: DUF86 domain-containing protein [Thermoanaerobacter]MDK2814469.1 hypothetical protein [Thermoanaerobacter sp.]MDP9751575.1 uncharacterized protein YutE (UPF0331/DUF86 family) [Thermoanaerobacter pentosaceus]
MTIDKDKIIKKINVIKKALTNLSELAKLTDNEFSSDFKYYDSAKYNLQIVIEAMIDIGNHIISRLNYEPPKTYADTFEILTKHNILPYDSANTYKLMAKFRNRIVHFYDDISNLEVYNIIQNNLRDFENFLKYISIFLKNFE